MKLAILLVAMMGFSTSIFAADCDDQSFAEISNLAEEVSMAVTKVKYSCSNKDLVSGYFLVGGGTNVYVDHANGSVDVTTINGYPPFAEVLSSVLRKENKYQADAESRFVGQTQYSSISFTLDQINTSGTLIRKSVWNNVERIEAFICDRIQE